MRIAFVIPGDIDTPTGGYRYAKNILKQWDAIGQASRVFILEGAYPFPDSRNRKLAMERVDEILSWADVIVVDGLGGGALPDFMNALACKKPLAALVHHPLCLENGLSTAQSESLRNCEHKALSYAKAVITPSPATAKTVAELFDYNPADIFTVLPGVKRGRISPSRSSGKVNLLCVASIIERKGHAFLLDALARTKFRNWELNLFGMMDADRKLPEKLKTQSTRLGLDDQINFHGSVADHTLETAYEQADVFVLPSLYEGYGMVYAEAIVRGLPVIATNAGAIPDTVPDSCGILVAPGEVDALGNALDVMIGSPQTRSDYAKGCILAEPSFPTWEQSADAFLGILERIR